MSNEQKAPPTPARPTDGPTRIPIKHLYAWTDGMSLPSVKDGGTFNSISNQACGVHATRAYHTAVWFPDWGVIEVTYHPAGGAQPGETWVMPTKNFRHWVKE